jgi:hypothetical protein
MAMLGRLSPSLNLVDTGAHGNLCGGAHFDFPELNLHMVLSLHRSTDWSGLFTLS